MPTRRRARLCPATVSGVVAQVRSLYAAFDRYPAPKGAATHIARAAGTLFDVCGGGLLYVLGDDDLPAAQEEVHGGNPVRIERCEAARSEVNLLRRAEVFGAGVDAVLDRHGATLELVQFRDPWGGVPALTHPRRRCPAVYEVNGLPSVELPVRFPGLAAATIARLEALEDFCLERADVVLTPGHTIASNLVTRGVEPSKITVVPNGADVSPPQQRPADAPERYVVYVGALQPWQGVDVALRAMARLEDVPVDLVVVTSARRRHAGALRRLARRLGIAEAVRWVHRIPHSEVAVWLEHAEASLAPLTDSARNVAQGCAPLKIVESLAAGTPVVASDLPVVREVVEDGLCGRLVPPDRPATLARAVRMLVEDPATATRMGRAARDHVVAAGLTWSAAAAVQSAALGALLGNTGAP